MEPPETSSGPISSGKFCVKAFLAKTELMFSDSDAISFGVMPDLHAIQLEVCPLWH